ncbi:MAG: copper chaperone PCu(A)C, partial [Plesiomonas sp.]
MTQITVNLAVLPARRFGGLSVLLPPDLSAATFTDKDIIMQKGLLALFLLSCILLSNLVFSPTVQAEVTIAQPYARATVANANVSAVFLTLFNPESDERQLVSVSSPLAGKVEMHQSSTNTQGVMSMQIVAQITIPPKG